MVTMKKQILFNKEAREKLAKGADILARAVVSTLGPRSKNVAINGFPRPIVVHDGVTVARSINLKDPFEDMGAVLLREAASKTNDLAGDGTTTATLIANTLVQEGIKITESGIIDGVVSPRINAMHLKEQLEMFSKIIVEEIEMKARKIKKGDIKRIANISAGNEDIAELVASAIEKVGSDGLVMVENSTSFESTVEYTNGMEFDNGFLSAYFVTDPNRMIVEHEDAYVLLTDMSIADPMVLVPIIEKVIEEGQNKKALLIIANDVVGPALQALVLTKLKQGVPLVAVVAPEYADRRKQMLEDIAVLTGANVFSADRKDDIKECKLSDLGKASVRISQTHTLITPLFPDKEEIKDRANAIKEQIDIADSPFLKERLQYRLAKLTQGVAVINVGGASESEINEKRERVIDAVHAVKAAMVDGIVAGGGVALRDIARGMKANEPIINLIRKTLNTPYETILSNSGIDFFELPDGVGMDVMKRQEVNMIDAGIIDPAKVTKLAVIHGFSVAGMMLTTNTLIADIEDNNIQKIKVVNRELEQ